MDLGDPSVGHYQQSTEPCDQAELPSKQAKFQKNHEKF